MCEHISLSVPVGILIEYEGMEWSPTLIPKAEVSVLSLNPLLLLRNVKRLVPSLLHHPVPSLLRHPVPSLILRPVPSIICRCWSHPASSLICC